MTKKKQEDQKEQETEKLSEWQKRNKEYLEKKAQEEAEKEKELAEQKKQHLPNPEKSDVGEEDEKAEVTSDTQEAESEDLEESTVTEFSEEEQDELLDKATLRKKKKAERKQAKQEAKETREKIAPRHIYRALPVLILSSILLILAVYFISPYSKLKNIEVTGNKQLSKTEVLDASGIQKEDYTLTTYLSQKAHARNIKLSNLWVKKAEISYQFPITFKIKITEYTVVAYDYSGEQYFPVLSSGEEIATPVKKSQLPKSYITLDFSDKAMLKKFVQQLSSISDTIKSEIQTVQHTPSKATEDLLTITMTDGNKILVPLSEVAKKLPYYEKIKPQLTETSVVDMEAGIFSYRNS
ncbi:FtsQ-type POTRA domain-containing protein [Streptococcus sp. IsoGale021]|uniref:cell division protein FtsQ/DivIB n=1 Tax=Streptococcus TaxID=1301 RepID=UPI00200115BE|nr:MULTISPECIES: FtsQ-type POTRA domain-containing protein [Streptococcus]MCY7210848.1 FtsQ-type POTRA domain-containing protein [Streptococcus anginosus]MCY7212432.1 FtsQ-type POTRA domain-containing protein [Streptococcus anginosus]MCY7226275.1 FtsQ-type POTRA domain-containing protein [Streptococcus anginosus]MDQ8694623.1 FtsQ-type POTRA domain-containing protein [Streptococcus sp. IsoGale021]MDU5128886.1 FtsQ-type POTRA domain-containing protein [Streptococcus anginosus]